MIVNIYFINHQIFFSSAPLKAANNTAQGEAKQSEKKIFIIDNMFEYIPEYNGLSNVICDDFRNDEEREFLTLLYERKEYWEQYGFGEDDFVMFYDGDTVTVAFDICDNTENVVMRALRVDFNETNLLLGRDLTAQFVCKLDINDPEVKEYRKSDYSTSELAEIAAEWLESEASRKIERREWITSSGRYHEYIFIDTNQPILVSSSKNKFRRSLFSPTSVKIVSPKLNNQPPKTNNQK